MNDARLVVPALEDEPWPTLGPEVCDWIEAELVHGPGDVLGEDIHLTQEFRAFTWRAYEVFPREHPQAGRRRFKRVVLSRRKGAAKTEHAAFIAIAEGDPTAPVRCDGWRHEGGLWVPVGRPVRDPYIPMVAVTEIQVEDLAYGAVLAILSHDRCQLTDQYEIGLERITPRYAPGKIAPLAGAPSGRDGARTSFQHFDETHLFTLERLKKAHATMLRNVPKRREADAWSLETTTAYEPGEDSVAEGSHKYALDVAHERITDSRLLFDHRQASERWDLDDPDQLIAAIREASGDAIEWADEPAILSQFDDPQADEADLRRYWLNQPRRSTRRWFTAGGWERLAKPRETVEGEVVLGFAGSYDRGSTVLVGCTVEREPYVFVIREWERPATAAPGWRPSVNDILDVVAGTLSERDVRELAVVPTGWRSEVEDWEGEYGEVVVRFELNKTSVWGPACDEFEQAVNGGTLTHDGSALLARHIGEAVPVERAGYKVLQAPAPAAAVAAVIAYSRARWHGNNREGLVPLAAIT